MGTGAITGTTVVGEMEWGLTQPANSPLIYYR
jgi:hypothetical protein